MTLRLLQPPPPTSPPLTVFLVREAAEQGQDVNPFRWFRPTAPQLRMLECTERRVCFRGPNQIGKTWAMAADVVDMMLGIGRWQPERARKHPPPVRIWVICESWDQSKTIQSKIFAMLPKNELHHKSSFTEKNGFAGDSFQTRNGSICAIKTVNQGTEKLESATLDGIFVDEPPPAEIWGTLIMRTRNRGGAIRMYFTPVNKPTEWLQELVKKGALYDIHTPLCAEALLPINDDGSAALVPFQNIDALLADAEALPAHEYDQRIKGAWRGTPIGKLFPRYDESKHCRAPDRQSWPVVSVGFDWGTAPGKMSAALVYCADVQTARPKWFFVDAIMAGPNEIWDGVELAVRTREMLHRNGLTYHDVDRWVGDREAQARNHDVRVNRQAMRGHLQHAFKLQSHQVRGVHLATKGRGSLLTQCSLIDGAFHLGNAWVNPAAPKELRDFFVFFDGNPKDPLKDIGDAARYAAVSPVNLSLCYRYTGT